jgi:hypothetical protein
VYEFAITLGSIKYASVCTQNVAAPDVANDCGFSLNVSLNILFMARLPKWTRASSLSLGRTSLDK